jgi:hypothetical protein
VTGMPQTPDERQALATIENALGTAATSGGDRTGDAQGVGGGRSTQPPGPGSVAAASGPHVPLA